MFVGVGVFVGAGSSSSPFLDNALTLQFANLGDADLLVGDATNVADWNTFFDLPTNGSEFDSVIVKGKYVSLFQNSTFFIKPNCFQNYLNLIAIVDKNNSVAEVLYNAFDGCGNLKIVKLPYSGAFGDYAFQNCTSVITFNLPLLTTAGDWCFAYCSSATTFNLSLLTSAGDNCFYFCTSATIFYLPLLTTAGNECFYWCTSALGFSFPNLTTAGNSCFFNCTPATTFDFPLLTTAGNSCFDSCNSATEFNFPLLTTAGTDCFGQCTSATTFNLPLLTSAGDNCFNYCYSAIIFNLQSCTNLGSTVGNNYVFYLIAGLDIVLYVPDALLTCNGGNPDGDIEYLVANNNVAINPFEIKFNGYYDADTLVGDATNIADWNTFFDLPTNGTPFDKVIRLGDTNYYLEGGANIHIKDNAFRYYPYIITSFNDSNGCIISAGNYSFYDNNASTFKFPALVTIGNFCFDGTNNYGVYDLSALVSAGDYAFAFSRISIQEFPSLTTIGIYCFRRYRSINKELHLPLLTSAGEYACSFQNNAIEVVTMPLLVTAPNALFGYAYTVKEFYMPSLVTCNWASFAQCTSATKFDFPLAETLIYNTFYGSSSWVTIPIEISIPSCTNLGTTVGDDSVWLLTDKIITLNVNASRMTCNGGNPDGDIQYLQANNTVSITTI